MQKILERIEAKLEEHDRRFDQIDQRLEAHDRRWEENDRRWEVSERRWEENDRRWEESDRRWNDTKQRFEQLEEQFHLFRVEQEDHRKQTHQILDAVLYIAEQVTDQQTLRKRLDNHEYRIDALERSFKTVPRQP